MTLTTRPAWPFPYSVRGGVIVRNGPPADTAPQKKQRKERVKRVAPKGEGAKW